jgi:hypothetical protein
MTSGGAAISGTTFAMPAANTTLYAVWSMLGDVNGDGSVDLTDALMIVKYYNNQITLNSAQLKAADVNGDGSVDLTDALIIAKYYNNLGNTYNLR